jgi:uncharacterized membrane protein YhaH (DUF805 family)
MTVSPLRAAWRYLAGRCRRQEYWISVVALIGAGLALRLAPASTALGWTLFAAWLLLASRRLRDIGWSPWLCLAPIAASLAVFFGVFALASSGDGRGGEAMLNIAPFALLAIWVGFWTLIGVWKSRPSDLPTPQARAEVFG